MYSFIRKHYHWVIAFIVLIELAVYSGILNNYIGLHLIPITEDLQISRGSFSLAFSIRPLGGFFSTLFSGVFYTKFGYRKLASAALLLAGVSFFLLGCCNTVFMLGLCSALLGLSEGFCTTAVASRMVNTWFYSHQGLVLGLVTASTGLGGSLFSIVLTGVIEANSWRYSFYLSALLVAAVSILVFLLVRNRPGEMNLLPFGAGYGHGKKPRRSTRDHWVGYDAKHVLHSPSFYLTAVIIFLSCACTYAAYSVVVPHFQDLGMSATEAAGVQSIMLLSLAAAKFLCGTLSDLLGAKFINLFCMICSCVGLVLLTMANSFSIAVTASIFFSLGTVMTTITIPLLSSALFGYKPQGTIIGILMALVPASSVITCPIVNMLYDRIGSYSPIFLFTAGMGAVVCVLMVILFGMTGRDRKQFEASHASMPELEELL